MKRFKNILVGVDLSEPSRFVSNQPAPPSQAAIDRAVSLAKANSAHLLFMYVPDASTIQIPEDPSALPDTFPDQTELIRNAEEVVSKIVGDAKQHGVTAEKRVTFGKSWIELIRQVQRGNHDLVIAGTRRFGPIRSMLFGSTGMKLLRQCPCPVWLTQPQPERIASILVAHDLQPVGDLAMELGCSMAKAHGTQLHVVHVIRFPEMDDMFPSRVSAEDVKNARDKAEQHIIRQLENYQLSKPAQVHLKFGAAHSHILTLMEEHNVDLVALGTVARTGIAGFFTGNTAERLLPHIPCSVIAVKPPGFKSSVSLG